MPYKIIPDSFHTGVTAEALQAKIERKSTISHQRCHFDPKFQVQGVAPTNLHTQLGQWMPYNFAADSFHTKKLCSRLYSSEVRFFYANRLFCVFQTPFGGFKDDDHLRLIGKRVVDFLLALIELFSLGVTAKALRAIIGSKSAILLQREPIDPKFQVEGVAPPPHQRFFFSEN